MKSTSLLAGILVLMMIFVSTQLFINDAICGQATDSQKVLFLTMVPAKTTIRVGETASIRLIANLENGTQKTVKTEKFKGEETGVFPITSEYEGEKTLILAKVFVIENKEIEEVFFRPKEIAIVIGETALLNLLARFKDGSEGIISTEEFRSTATGSFPLSSSFEAKKATASILVREASLARVPLKRSDFIRCPRLQPCSDCHSVSSL